MLLKTVTILKKGNTTIEKDIESRGKKKMRFNTRKRQNKTSA